VSRKEWAAGTSRKHRDDARRPLDRRGKRQAEALPQILDCYAVHRLVSSSAARCVQTLTPYAKQIGVDVRADDELTEEVHTEDPDRTGARMCRIVADALNDPAQPVAICGHRPVLPLMNHALGVVYHPMSTAECLIVHLDRDGKSLAEERLDSII
ncbi:phosphoglycerate mutase family protein, partial [Cutibacterium granulosum]|uniref:SixA phosphatase family protein n=1 Tax=Cutibacterium granulosum TaxID=33011 RepID=UPI002B226D4D